MEVKVILILIIIHYLRIFIFKPNFNTLNCGIFGWSGKDPKTFNRDKFDKLGIFNITRGRDSCGFAIDGFRYIGFGHKEKEYIDYIAFNGNNERPSKIPAVIGHTRQASVGIPVTIQNVHPFGFGENKKLYNEHIGKYGCKFLFAHNGTLKNYKDLAKKYLIKTVHYVDGVEKEKSDSHILGEIIYTTKSFNVLSEYIGGAACTFVDTQTNTLYLFKGESSEYPNWKDTDVERPLFYYVENKNSLYFSSIKESLISIGGIEDETVFELESNMVYQIKNGDIENAVKYPIDRSSASQKEITYYSNTNVYKGGSAAASAKTFMDYETNNNVLQLPLGKLTLKNSDNIIFEKKYPIAEQMKKIAMIQDITQNGGILHFKYGLFYSNRNKLFTGLALNVKNFGLVSLLDIYSLNDLKTVNEYNLQELLKYCNEYISKNLYFKLIKADTGLNHQDNGFNLINAKFKENKYTDDEVKMIFNSGKLDKYFLLTPGSLNINKDFINDVNDIVYVVDGAIISNYSEFKMFITRLLKSGTFTTLDFSDETIIFTKHIDVLSFSAHFKYYVPFINSTFTADMLSQYAFTFYNPEGKLIINSLIAGEGFPHMVEIRSGKLDNVYYFKNSEKEIFIHDDYRKEGNKVTLRLTYNIQDLLKDLSKDLKTLLSSKEMTNYLNLTCDEIEVISNRITRSVDFFTFDEDDLKKFLNDKHFIGFTAIKEEDLENINTFETINALLDLGNIFQIFINKFLDNNLSNPILLQHKRDIDDIISMCEAELNEKNN